MKRFLTGLLLLTTAFSSVFAEIHSSKRKIEFGSETKMSLDQNVIFANDIFQEYAVIDFTEISEGLEGKGSILDIGLNTNAFFRANFKTFGFGLDLAGDVLTRFTIGQGFWDLLGKGNQVDVPVETSVGFRFESYLTAGFSFSKTFGKIRVTAAPTAFVPVVYIADSDSKLTMIDRSDGSIDADLDMRFNIYSVMNPGMFGPVLSMLNIEGIESATSDLTATDLVLNAMGVDLGLEVEYPLTPIIDLALYGRVPLKPALMKNQISFGAKGYGKLGNFLEFFDNMSQESNMDDLFGYGFETTPAQYRGDADFQINRPTRVGLTAAIRPVFNLLTIRPTIGCGFHNLGGTDFDKEKDIYPEYGLSVDFKFINIFEVNLAMEYMQEIFSNYITLGIDSHAAKFILRLGTTSPSFAKSWGMSGIKLVLGTHFGF